MSYRSIQTHKKRKKKRKRKKLNMNIFSCSLLLHLQFNDLNRYRDNIQFSGHLTYRSWFQVFKCYWKITLKEGRSFLCLILFYHFRCVIYSLVVQYVFLVCNRFISDHFKHNCNIIIRQEK